MSYGSYSAAYKGLDSNQAEHFRLERNEALTRAKKLQLETNKRRKAQALKRKQEAQREERRRKEILVKRKQDIREATEKFQRLNRHYSREDVEVQEEQEHYRTTPGLDEALRAVRGSSGAGTRPRPASAYHTFSSTVPAGSTRPHPHSASPAARTNPSRPANKPPLSPSRNLRNSSLHNLTNSRTLFEKQLEHHQQLLMEQQQNSLHHFNEAIIQEMENDKKLQGEEDEEVQDSNAMETESLSSVDSLEGSAVIVTNPRAGGQTNYVAPALKAYNPGEGFEAGYRSASSSSPGFVLHRNTSPNVAVVQPMSNNTPPYVAPVSNKVTSSGAGELQLEDVQEEDEVQQGGEQYQQKTDFFGTIQTSSNGRTNGQFHQDSIVNYTHQLSDTGATNHLYYHGPANNVGAVYDHKNYSDHQALTLETGDRTKNGWGASDTKTNATSFSSSGQAQTNSHMTTNSKPFTSRQTLTNTTMITGYSGAQSSNKPPVVCSQSLISSVSGTQGNYNSTLYSSSATSVPSSTVPTSQQYPFLPPGIEATANMATTTTTKSLFPSSVTAANDNLYNHFGLPQPTSNSDTLHALTGGTSASKANTTVSNPIPRSSSLHSQASTLTKGSESVGANTANGNQTKENQTRTCPVPTTAITLVQQKPAAAYKQSMTSTTAQQPTAHSLKTAIQIEAPEVSSHQTIPVSVQSRPIPSYRQSSTVTTASQQQPTTTATAYRQSSTVTTAEQPPLPPPPTTAERYSAVNLQTTTTQQQTTTATTASNRQAATALSKQAAVEKPYKAKPKPSTTSTATAANTTNSSTYYSYKVAPSSEKAAKSASKKDIPVIHDEKEEEEDQNVAAEEESNGYVVKGILKRRGNSSTPKKSVRIGGVIGKGSNRSLAASVRDSIEVSREKKEQEEQKKAMKSEKRVRFSPDEDSDNSEEEEEEEEVPEASTVQMPYKPDQNNNSRNVAQPPSQPKPTRPVSAKTTSTQPTTRGAARAASAGTVNRGPFLRPHPPSQPPSGRATLAPKTQLPSSKIPKAKSDPKPANANHSSNRSDNHEKNVMQPNGKGAVYGTNGLRLDRTPTDDEINWLWEKVRTCLDQPEADIPLERQTATVHTKFIDGANLSQKGRQPMRVQSAGHVGGKQHSNQYGNQHSNQHSNQHGNQHANQSGHDTASATVLGRKKITMDTLNTYSRRAALLQQRKNSAAATTTTTNTTGGASNGTQGTISYHNPPQPSQTTVHTLGGNGTGNRNSIYHPPQPSNAVPSNSTAVGVAGTGSNVPPPKVITNFNTAGAEHVSESMAGFLAAEKLAQQSASESEIEIAMDSAHYKQYMHNTKQQHKVPSAISIEEQRLMQSLERLNERLQAQEAGGYHHTQSALVPRPPAMVQHGGFRGHAPKSSAPRRHLNSNGMVTRHQFMTSNTAAQQHRQQQQQQQQHNTAATSTIRYR